MGPSSDRSAAAPRLGAVVLAGGESSRMGAVKALLPVGPGNALERVVGSLRRAGVEEIVAVTGYHAESVAAAVASLGLTRAHNAAPERGMFSSVHTGVAALTQGCEAFFVLPVDYPLVNPRVLSLTSAAFAADQSAVMHPCCAGLRGHPPLVAESLRQPLLAAPPEADLRSALSQAAAGEIEVEDLTILLDMDTPADLERLRRLAVYLDAAPPGTAADKAGGREPGQAWPGGISLQTADALHILDLLRAPARVVAHCRAVAAVGERVAEALHDFLPTLDVDLVRVACLLHDMVREQGPRKHAVMAERILRNLGLDRLGHVVGGHMVLPLDPAVSPEVTEEELVYLADKMVVEDRAEGLLQRERRALERCGDDEEARRGIRARMATAEVIDAKVERILGRPVEAVVAAAEPGA